jgi:hypothetical protein
MLMDPVNCPMCNGAIPGKEIRTLNSCPSCGANLSGLIRKRLGAQLPAIIPPPQSSSFLAHAALLSLLAPCIGIAVYLVGDRAGMDVLEVFSLLVIAAGFILGVVAFFAPKGERARAKSVAGIFINALLLCFAIFSIFTRPTVAARRETAPQPQRKPWTYMSGK